MLLTNTRPGQPARLSARMLYSESASGREIGANGPGRDNPGPHNTHAPAAKRSGFNAHTVPPLYAGNALTSTLGSVTEATPALGRR